VARIAERRASGLKWFTKKRDRPRLRPVLRINFLIKRRFPIIKSFQINQLMKRGRPKGTSKFGPRALTFKSPRPSAQISVSAAALTTPSPITLGSGADAKQGRRQREAILGIKPTSSTLKKKSKLQELTQGNFYKKAYREKAC